MRIAQVAPLDESVPPKLYGGTERVVSHLTEELVRQGHDVTLFASADSRTSARLVPIVPNALRLRNCAGSLAAHVLALTKVWQAASSFDIVHFHTDFLHFPLNRLHRLPQLTTLHGRLDLPEFDNLYREYRDMPLVSISDSQRVPLPFANWVATIHHGLPEKLFAFNPAPGKYLAFVGRVSREKRLDRAIEIAKRIGMELWIAAKIDPADEPYYEQIRPLLRDPLVRYIGEIGEHEKQRFLGNAYALLFPIEWPEPFGLVLIEALACGTPVIAFAHGAVPEILTDGETGYIVNDVDAAVTAVRRLEHFNRQRCRRVFEKRFSAQRMTQEYVAAYRRVLATEVAPCQVA